MQYRKDKKGNDLSILGYGCMRFSKKGNQIDIEKTEKEIMAAYKAGVNYYDTAYIYPGSEAALGEILERNKIREKVNIATKLPQYLINNGKGLDKYFSEELSRLRTTYVDYYLMHHLTDVEMWEKLKRVGILDWIKQKKEAGEIRNIGFSYHGNTENFITILNDYDWDFCQVQYNYLDEVTQAGVKGVKAAAQKGIPVVIMEPLRGGKLVNMLPEKAKKLFAENQHGWSPAEWAFRWLYNQPEITVVLSGMNSLQMVEENIKTASEMKAGDFTEEDFELLEKVKQAIKEKEKVGCTGCRYCMPCPKGVDIPGIFACYNTMYIESKREGRFQFAQTVGLTKEPAFATQCIECGKCEQHCPQNIPIREKLKEADKALRPLTYKVGINVARKFMFRKKKQAK
ncbi:MAG: aldo/keto reductase [Lachnospiraceae bacterium]|jgi:predicted aldo/keto reductase-like oxidoreductase|nr:aldo/keto reductase [Lachnospiraceae bacterium]